MRSIVLVLAVAVAVAACGGSSKSDVEEPGGDPVAHEHEGAEHEQHGDAHPELTAEMHAFHDVLAPLWHSQAPDRQSATCENAGPMLALAEKIQDAPNPGVAANVWGPAVRDLMVALMKLMDECKSGGDFEANFGAVHDGFHRLMDLLPPKGP